MAVLVAFAATLSFSVYAQRSAAEQAALLRSGYVPLLLSLDAALETQNLVSAQLNHITDARNPADARGWIETQRRVRPVSFAGVRSAADRGLMQNEAARALGAEITSEVSDIERFLAGDGDVLARLYDALARGDRPAAEALRDEALHREIDGAQRLRDLTRRVDRAMDELTSAAIARERRATTAILALSIVSLAVGIALALYARRVLAPLSRVTARARAVAEGDLGAKPVVEAAGEIGELARTFEGMVSAIARARGELVQAERLAGVGRMAAHVTHEIRNPISAMGLNMELLEEELAPLDDAAEARQLARAIGREIERLAKLSEQYLMLARRPRPALAAGDLGELVDEIVAFVTPELTRANVTIAFERDEPLPTVAFDESQLRQALVNLVRNAREAMPQGGSVVIGLRRDDATDGVALTIDDTGEGIPEDARATIFDPFFSTKRQGTGLGLAITREIVEAHGGHIACEPRTPKGTRFRIVLPAAKAA